MDQVAALEYRWSDALSKIVDRLAPSDDGFISRASTLLCSMVMNNEDGR
jgi:hypothetical protein